MSFFHDRAGYKLRNQLSNIGRQKLNMFYLHSELNQTEKPDFALGQKGQ